MLKNYFKINGYWLVLIITIVLGLFVRTKNFNVLPIDAHPMRQTDTECVAYFMYSGKSSFFKPKSCLIRPVSNTNGYFFLEMPFYELLIATSYKIFGYYPFSARMVNLVLYIFGSLALFGFMSKWWSNKIGLMSVFIFSFIPGSIFFVGHAIHPDALAVSFIFVSLFFAWKYQDKRKLYFLVLAGLSLGISVASRPFGLICLPLLFYFLYLKKSKWNDYLILFLLSIGFYVFWWWRKNNLGIDMNWEHWILTGREKLFQFEFLKKLIWKNIIGETMGKVVSGLAGIGLIVGLVKKDQKIIPLTLWLFGVIVYWLIAPDGNLTHQYYADVYIPLVVILATIGLNFIFEKSKLLMIMIIPLLIYNGIRTSDYHFDDRGKLSEVVIAKEIEKLIPEEKKIIYLAKDDSIPLSLSHRQGWILGEWPTDVAVHIWSFMEMRHFGFDYIVEPKDRMDLRTEDWDIIKLNYPLEKTGEYINIYKYR
jgi:hypothetical protein